MQELLDHPQPDANVANDLRTISERYLSGLALAYVTPVGNVIASYQPSDEPTAPTSIPTPVVVALAQSRVVEEVGAGQEEATSVLVVGRKLLSVAARRVFAPPAPLPGGRQVGIIIGVQRIRRRLPRDRGDR